MTVQGVRLPRLERGLYEALSGSADVVAWARGEQPRDVGSLLSLRLMQPPAPISIPTGRTTLRADSASITVTAATEDARSTLRLDGYTYVYDVQAGDTIEDVRDAFVAEITPIEAGRVEVASVGTDQIDLTPQVITALWDLWVTGELESSIVYGDAQRVSHDRQETIAVELQTFARGPHLEDGASAVLTEALSRLRDPARLRALAAWGVAPLEWTPPADISAIAGGGWETRASTVVRLNCRATYVAAVEEFRDVSPTIAAE